MAGKRSKAANIIEGIVIALLIILIAVMLVLYFTFSKTGAAPEVFGYTFYHTKAVNMAPDIPAGTAIIGQKSEIESIKRGDMILCTIGEDTVLIGVEELVSENGALSYIVKFKTAPQNDTFKITKENVIAKAVWQSAPLGKLISFATTTSGIIAVIIIPSIIIIVIQVIKIIGSRSSDDEYDFDGDELDALDGIDELMKDNGDRFFDINYNDPPVKQTGATDSFSAQPQVQTFLKVDANGKAGLNAAEPEGNTPLFTYDKLSKERSKPKAEQPPKPSTPNTDSFYQNYVNDTSRDNLYGDRIKRQEIVEEESEQSDKPLFDEQQQRFMEQSESVEYAQEPEREVQAQFMSNVIPQPIAQAVANAESAETSSEDMMIRYEPKVTASDAVISKAAKIPEKAVVPKERLAPPAKKKSSKAISELMSIIDSEKSKLGK